MALGRAGRSRIPRNTSSAEYRCCRDDTRPPFILRRERYDGISGDDGEPPPSASPGSETNRKSLFALRSYCKSLFENRNGRDFRKRIFSKRIDLEKIWCS